MREALLNIAYLGASILFILCLRGLSAPENGKKGLVYGEVGMLLAVVATLLDAKIVSYTWIASGLLLGSTAGVLISARLPMTKMPERIALSHAFGIAFDLFVGHCAPGASLAAVDRSVARVRLQIRISRVLCRVEKWGEVSIALGAGVGWG